MKLADVVGELNRFAPPAYQEDYDNSGLIVGDPAMEVSGILLSTDTTEAVVHEAIGKGANLIVSHHPLIFQGLKKITGRNYVERTVLLAIRNGIALYAGHTNFDSIYGGVNHQIAEKLGLTKTSILVPKTGALKKLVTFVPQSHADVVRMAIFNAGAGSIGAYDQCSYNVSGRGSFRGGEQTHPFTGSPGKLHFEEEIRIETIFPDLYREQIIQALLEAHPYEEAAYDIYPLENSYPKIGMGLTGYLEKPVNEETFLKDLKKTFAAGCIRHTPLLGKPVRKVAVCGGSGSMLLPDAIRLKADIFISADFKYHQFFNADGRIVIADIGHYESEQFTKEIFYKILTGKFPKFAVHFSEINTNPIKYF
ncbi:MAG: Nif3-like dinuclear metal center hexameric protein [Chlorobi bacterium]|nr:Nif3-like dinuclear metal center hexameric protein [Chlorobiota bacterium]